MRTFLALAVLLALATSVAAQVRTTGEIRGAVIDPSGAAVPGVTVTAKDLATANVLTAASGANGAYVFLNLQSGTYEISARAPGFQTALIKEVTVETGRTLDLNIPLTVGQLAETIEVQDIALVLQTTTNNVSTTIRHELVQSLPLTGRDTLQFAALMAGAQTPGEGTRNSTFNGLPNASLNIAIDGINNNSQRFKTGGTSFFGFTPARLDAIEEITTTTTGVGADSAAGGAMTIGFTTRRGSNQYHGRFFHQFANDALNANSFFNNLRGQPKAKVRRNDYGGNIGGPLPIPGMKNRLFFFVNIEYAPRPTQSNQSASILTTSAQQGNFSYLDSASGAVRTVNVLSLALANGYSNRIDPAIQTMLGQVNSSRGNGTGLTPNTNNPNFETLNFVRSGSNDTIFPTARLDYQISSKLAWHGTWNLRAFTTPGSPVYPGLEGKFTGAKATVYNASSVLDWTIAPTMLNNLRIGVQSTHEDFNQDDSVYQWAALGHRRIVIPAILGTTMPNPIVSETPWIRNNPVYSINDSLSWVRGKHTFVMGGSFLRTHFYETTWNNAGVLNYNLGVAAGDPISSAFVAAAFPGIRTADLGGAGALYSLLSGRLSSVAGSRNVNEISHAYEDFAPITQRFGFKTLGLFVQDSFRASSSLTLNYGFRWEISGAIHNRNNITTPPDLANFFGPSTGLFAPGVLNGVADPVLNVRPYTYSGDKINPAPNFGFAWNPKYKDGLLGRMLGSGTVISGNYGISYYDEGLNSISNRVSGNPGTTQSIALNPGINFAPGTLTFSGSLPAASVNPPSFSFPMPQRLFTFLNGTATTNPVLHTPYVQNWNFRIQREVGRGMVVEARYVGNKSTYMWHAYSMNETNIFENGFLQEFQNGQRNLQISTANGVANNFANRGLAGQVPLPIFDAAFAARGATQAALTAAQSYTSTTFLTPLQQGNAGGLANTMATSNIYYCRMVGSQLPGCGAAGYTSAGPFPINFFRPNPYVTGLTYLDDNSYATYHGLQIEFRKQPSKGLFVQASYTWSKALSDLYNLDLQDALEGYRTLRNRDLDKGPSAFDLRHVAIAFWAYDLPFGRGRAFLGSNGPVLDRIIGGWQVSGIHRYNSGQVYNLTSGRNTHNNLTDSGVILNGITAEELQNKLRTFRPGPNLNAAADPSLTQANGAANPAMLSVPTAPGQFGQFLYLYNTPLVVNNLTLSKDILIKEQVRMRLQFQTFNTFNHPVLGVGNMNIDSTSFGQTTAARVGARNVEARVQLDW